ncbi:MAG: hypothetical protein P1U32_01525 [Legionellaceae bacterium]|nr:hypothetical protein [Legionellaceae bacterium]
MMILLPHLLRNITENLFNQILHNRFNKALRNNTMPVRVFNQFIVQDKLYLGYYEQALRLAELCAPDVTARQLHRFRTDTIQYEKDLFAFYLVPEKKPGFFQAPSQPLPVVKAYGAHLLGQKTYARKIAALAPCFWLYASIGEHIDFSILADNNSYRPWLDAYADPTFKTAAEEMVVLLADSFEEVADDAERAKLVHIFFQSLKYEAQFFEDTYPVTLQEAAVKSLGVDDDRASFT